MDDFSDIYAHDVAGVGRSVMSAARAARAIADGASDVKDREKSALIAKNADYQEDDEAHVMENQVVTAESVVNLILKEKKELTTCGQAFKGQIDPNKARKLHISTVEHWTNESGKLLVPTKQQHGKGTCHTFSGFSNYGNVIGDKEEQKAHTAQIGKRFLNNGEAKECWPELHEVYEEVQKIVGDEFCLGLAHVLWNKSKSTIFTGHQDHKEHQGKDIELTVCMEMTDTKGTVKFMGDKEVTYDEPGTLVAFDAELWHRTGVAYVDTMKIVFFFELNDKSKKKKKGEKKEQKAKEEEGKEEVKVEVKKEGKEVAQEEEKGKKTEEAKSAEKKEGEEGGEPVAQEKKGGEAKQEDATAKEATTAEQAKTAEPVEASAKPQDTSAPDLGATSDASSPLKPADDGHVDKKPKTGATPKPDPSPKPSGKAGSKMATRANK